MTYTLIKTENDTVTFISDINVSSAIEYGAETLSGSGLSEQEVKDLFYEYEILPCD